MTNVLNNVTTAAIYIAWFGALAFCIAYTVVARWWQSGYGRMLFSLGLVTFAISSLAVLSHLFGQDYSARPWIRFLVWGATSAVTLGLCAALWRAQGRRRK